MSMTEKLYDANAYLTEFDATVVSCRAADSEATAGKPCADDGATAGKQCADGGAAADQPCAPLWEVVLDKTAFYPEGGGQPCDFGVLGGSQVTDVQEKDGIIYHLCSAPLEVGSSVHGTIDWDRRLMHMREHSGEHIISGIICHTHGYSNIGFHMGKDCVTIDFSGPLTAEQIQEAEDLANQKVLENVEIKAEYPDSETLVELDYRSKKELIGAIRIVTIPGADVCACCGTHVKYTGEVGPIKVISAEHAKGGSRLDILIGEKALADYKSRFENTQKISALLSVKPEQTAEATEKLLQTVADLKQELGALKMRMLEEKVDAVEAGSSACVLFEQGLSTVDVRKLADKLSRKVAFAAVFCGNDAEGYQYVICASDRDISAFGKTFNKALCGRGGGKNPMIQGQVKAGQTEIYEYLTKEGVLKDGE